jgi:phage terminase large subunit
VENVSKADGIAATQALLPYMRIDDTKCARLIDCLGTYRRKFNEQLQTYGQEPVHDWASHGADAMRMLSIGLRASGYDLKEAQAMQRVQQMGV